VAQHQSQCSIFANQQLKVSNIVLCSCCFRPSATWLSFRCWPTPIKCSCCFRPSATWLSFRCWPTPINPFTDCFHWAKLPTLFRKFRNNFSVSKTKFLQCLDPSFIFVQYFTHNQSYSRGLTAIVTWNIEEFMAYYNAMLHVNIKIMMAQQRWYLLLNYFNNKINILFSCEIRSWILCFHQFDIRQVNTAQSNTSVHSIVTNKWAKCGAKIFRHFCDIAIFVLGYFILPHPVYSCNHTVYVLLSNIKYSMTRISTNWDESTSSSIVWIILPMTKHDVIYTLCLKKTGPLRLIWYNFTNSQHLWISFCTDRPYSVVNSLC